MNPTKDGSWASSSSRLAGTRPSRRTGSCFDASQRSGSIHRKSCVVRSSHDQRRLWASSTRGASRSGIRARTTKLTTAFMHVTVTAQGTATVGRVPAHEGAGKTSKTTKPRTTKVARMSDRPLRVVINDVRPRTPDGVSAAKGTVGQRLDISANVFADGHDVVAARARWRSAGKKKWTDAPMTPLGNDRFAVAFVPGQVGPHEFEIDGWVDAHATWRHRAHAKVIAGQDVAQELEEGARLLDAECDRLPPDLARQAGRIAGILRDPMVDQA